MQVRILRSPSDKLFLGLFAHLKEGDVVDLKADEAKRLLSVKPAVAEAVKPKAAKA